MRILNEREPGGLMNKTWFCFSVVVLLAACHPASKNPDEPVQQLETIDLTNLWANPQEVKLSTIADSVFYIPLETKTGCFLSHWDHLHVEVLEKYLIVYEEDNVLRLFDRDGKYLLTFGGKGKGPGEYTVAREFTWDEEANRVYISDFYKKKVIVFDFSGKLIKEFDPQKNPCEITVSPNHDIGLLYLSFGNKRDTARLEWLTPEGKLIEKIQLYQNRLYAHTATWGLTELYWINGKLRITEPPFDTIYQLDQVSRFVGITRIIQGPNAIPREVWFNEERWKREAWDYRPIDRVLDCENSVFLNSTGKGFCRFLYNKLTKETFQVRWTQRKGVWFEGLCNDLDGGLPFWPRARTKDYLVVCTAYDDIESYFKGCSMTEPDSLVNPVLHKRFVAMANGLKENDNPVVVVVRMKK
ncbi:MAG: 6-bladed beta-propeller [Bacteroidia bacterium]|nr:6-bladed beta-propeller [Bacteroidia bacterium]